MHVQTRSVACGGGEKEGVSVSCLFSPPPLGRQGGSRSDKCLTRSSRQDAGASFSHSKSGGEARGSCAGPQWEGDNAATALEREVTQGSLERGH